MNFDDDLIDHRSWRKLWLFKKVEKHPRDAVCAGRTTSLLVHHFQWIRPLANHTFVIALRRTAFIAVSR
jgi:hypothetical protein